MAGIGIHLRKLTRTGSIADTLAAYSGAAVVSAGPWIISIIALMLLTWLLHQVLPADEIRLFTSSVTHVYAFALILTGPLQILLTRYTADQISLNHPERIYPSFRGGVLVAAVVHALLGWFFFVQHVPAPPGFSVAAAALLVQVACIFIASVYLSTLRHYVSIVAAFALGYGVGIAAAWKLAATHGVAGAMAGLLAGHFLLFLTLVIRIRSELGRGRGSAFAFWRTGWHMPGLLLTGLFYNLGIWIDKFLFWWMSKHYAVVAGVLHAAPDYDLAIYLSLLSIAPGMAVFFLQVETRFSEAFHHYFDCVNGGRSLMEIRQAKHQIIHSLREGFARLVKVQGVATLLLVLFAHQLAGWFQVGFVQLGILRITLFGGFLLMVFLAMLTVLFYFNDRRGALLCSLAFLLANGCLSALTLQRNEAWYGFGFVAASALAVFIATVRVNRRLDQLEFHTFRGEP
ncbi:MAG: exopolysaccharide Pel transporter PelG [Verrucomicrobiales bacterium]|nr:exopolysaccharide Pel transporter PelG [Verrucomicrobiales bacterium]